MPNIRLVVIRPLARPLVLTVINGVHSPNMRTMGSRAENNSPQEKAAFEEAQAKSGAPNPLLLNPKPQTLDPKP